MYEQFISNLTYEVKSRNIPVSRSDDVVAEFFRSNLKQVSLSTLMPTRGLNHLLACK